MSQSLIPPPATENAVANVQDSADDEYELTVDISNLVIEDDTPVDNLFSEKQQRLLTESLYSSWTGPKSETGDQRTFLAAANVGLFASIHQPPLVPDVFLSLDVQVKDLSQRKNRTYFFWEFGKPPDVVIEIVSNRKGKEIEGKFHEYARLWIQYYVVFDPFKILGEDILHTYELQHRKYERRPDSMLPDAGLGLTLWEGIYENEPDVWLRWCDEKRNLNSNWC